MAVRPVEKQTIWGGMRTLDGRIILVILFCVALVLRLGAVFILGVPDPTQASEDGMIAGRLVSGQGYTFDLYGYRATAPLRSYMPPLYVLFVAFFLRFWNPTGLGVAQAVLSSMTPLLIYHFARRQEGVQVGLLAASIVAIYPVFVVQAARPFTLSLLSLLLMSWLTLTSSKRAQRHPRSWIVIGALAGLASLIRTSMLGLVAINLVWVGLRRRQHVAPWRAATLMIVGAVLVVGPWIVRNVAVHHAPMLVSTNGGFTFWNGNNPFTTGSAFDVYLSRASDYLGEPLSVDGQTAGIAHVRPYPLPHEVSPVVGQLPELEMDRMFYRAGLTFIQENPRMWLSLFLRKIISLWWFRPHIGQSRSDLGPGGMIYRSAWILPYKLLYAGMFPFFIGGLLLSLREARFYLLVYLLLAYLTGIYALFNVTTRYRWEVEPLVLIFAALALWRVAQTIKTSIGEKAGLHP